LLALGGDDVNRQAGVFQSIPDFPERMAFACARAATEQRDKIAGAENLLCCLALIGLRLAIRDVFRTKSLVLASAVSRQADDFPFTSEHFAGCDFAGSFIAAEILAETAHRFDVVNRQASSSRVFQGNAPKLLLVNHRTAIE